jgi:hypothetical protein
MIVPYENSAVHDTPLTVYLTSAISPDTSSPSSISTSRNQGVSRVANGVATHKGIHNESSDLHSAECEVL